MSTAAFSCDGSAVITRKLDVGKHGGHLAEQESDLICDVKRCTRWINSGNYLTVALQFPDELLGYSTVIAGKLMKLCQKTQFCILADTSYGSCCVDEIAAQHYNADAIIHFGHACLSPNHRLAVLYEFDQSTIDLDDCVEAVTKLIADAQTKILLFYDVSYFHTVDALAAALHKYYNHLLVSCLMIPESNLCSHAELDENKTTRNMAGEMDKGTDTELCKFGRKWHIPHGNTMNDYEMLYIGQESCTLTNLMMSFSGCRFNTYNPLTQHCRTESVSINKMLMKRYYLIERAKDAQIVGIVVGTLGVSDYLLSINRLKKIIHLAGKKSYTFAMGKLNVAKLANFMEVDIYVLVACPENSLLDSSEFYRPVVTPYELEIALNPDREWNNKFTSDFRELLPGADEYVAMSEDVQEAKADVSLVTGSIRRLGLEQGAGEERVLSSDMLPRESALTMATQDAGYFLSNRQWQGLEQKMGQTPVTQAVKGTSGVASAYDHEPN